MEVEKKLKFEFPAELLPKNERTEKFMAIRHAEEE